jgi:HEAT repeat protein
MVRRFFIFTAFYIFLSVFAQAKASDDWETRLTSNDPKVRATAEATLVEGKSRSLPLLRKFLDVPNQDLHDATFEIIRRIGPPAIPLLAELLQHEQVSIRRTAADALIDLAPHTQTIQAVMRRALKDDDPQVAAFMPRKR